jgi:hypothetical protein
VSKKKGKQKAKAREKRARSSRERRKRRSSQRQQAAVAVEHLPAPSLDWVRPDRLLPPVFVDKTGAVVPDPWQILGLAAGERDPEVIRRAWRDQLVAHPPEAEPERARQIREARDRLIEPERVLERELGVLRAPDPSAWGLATELPALDADKLDAEDRLAGQALLYTLVEDVLLEGGLSEWLRLQGQ